MEQEISGISKFPEKRATSRGGPKISKRISWNFSVSFDFEPEFLEILVEWNAPYMYVLSSTDHVITKDVKGPNMI